VTAAETATPDSSDLPARMRVSVLRAPHDVVVEQRPTPTPRGRQVLVKVLSVGTCGSDTHYYEHGRIGDHIVEKPLVLGHEAAGEIVALGPDVESLAVGQRISIEPGVPDFTCAECRAGRYNLCPGMVFFGTPPIDGAFAQFVLVHEAMAYPIPDEVSDDAAALLEPVSVAVWSCTKAGVRPGSRVLVTGAGPIGLLVTQVARAFGASSVVVTDVNPHRLALAARLGATRTVDVSTEDLAAAFDDVTAPDVYIDASGVPAVVKAGVRALRRAGRAVLVGMGADEVALPVSRIQNFELTVTGTFRYANTWPIALELVHRGQIDVDTLVTHRVGLADVDSALTAAARDATAVKVVVRPQE
jgi:L-iditol 2-dehydrogenase